jgi:cell division protein FtsL
MIGLSPQETKEEQGTAARSESTTLSKKNFASIIVVSFLLIGISAVISQFVFYDSNSEEAEKVLQKLDNDYKIGKTCIDKYTNNMITDYKMYTIGICLAYDIIINNNDRFALIWRG